MTPTELRRPEYRGGKSLAELQAARAALGPPLAVPVKVSKPPDIRTAHRTELPATAPRPPEAKPLSKYDDNPVLNSQGAAFIVGVSADLLKKWRQRDQGPDYIQYVPGGLVFYEIKALLAFRDEYKVYLSNR